MNHLIMTRFLHVLALIACLPAVQPLLAQPGSVDPSWNPIDVGYGSGKGATISYSVVSLAIQPDGRVVVAGDFTDYNDTRCHGLVRLETDGTVDPTFISSFQQSGPTNVIIQPDGKLLLCGSPIPILYSSRLLPNGQFDPDFGFGHEPDSTVWGMALRADGKVMMAGAFNMIGSVYRPHVARVNSDGSLDATFDMGTGTDAIATKVIVQPDDKVIIAGPFFEVNGTFSPRLARLNADGTFDATFNVSSGFLGSVHALQLQPDGRLLVAGDFIPNNGPVLRLVRLMPDGSVDATFNTGSGFNDAVHSLVLRDDGRIVAGGDFTQVNGGAHERMVQLLADGSIDPTFAVGDGPNDRVVTMAEQADGKVVHGGRMFLHGQRHRMRLGRVHADGADDLLYNVGTGAAGRVQGLAEQPDGRILITGAFMSYNDTLAGRIVRVLPDGFVDTSFHAYSGVLSAVGNIRSVVVQPDGHILVGGSFVSYGSMTGKNIARLLPNGEVDTTFDVGAGPIQPVHAIALQDDGKVLIGGLFTQVDGTPRNHIARLNADGSLDATFDPGTGFSHAVNALALHADGKIVAGGTFTTFNGTTVRRLAQLLPDGGLDPAFNHQYGAEPGEYVSCIAIAPDGRILIGGNFSSYDLQSGDNLARLLPDGSTDPTFPNSLDPDGIVASIGLQDDGRIVFGGAFNEVAGVPRIHVARLNANGTLDPQFDPGAGPEGTVTGQVSSMCVLSTGKVLIGGAFTSVDGIGRNHVARLFGGGSVDLGAAARAPEKGWGVYPVPSTGMVQLDLLAGATVVEVLSPEGQFMGQHRFAQQLDLSDHPAGTYVLRVLNAAASTLAVRRVVLTGQ